MTELDKMIEISTHIVVFQPLIAVILGVSLNAREPIVLSGNGFLEHLNVRYAIDGDTFVDVVCVIP